MKARTAKAAKKYSESTAMKSNGRISAADHVAFAAESKIIRKALKAIKHDRHRQFYGKHHEWHPTADQLAVHRARIMPIRDRLRYWRTVLMADERRIKHPVRLWDSWNRLRLATDLEITDLAYDFSDKSVKVRPTHLPAQQPHSRLS
jgi:hypothetical protein